MLKTDFTPEQKALFQEMDVAICSPLFHIRARWVRSLVNAMAYAWGNGLRVYEMAMTYEQVVDWARNTIAEAMVNAVNPHTGKKYTHLLWLDDDHVFNADMFVVLASHFTRPEVDAVSALYFSRSAEPLPCAYVKDLSADKHKHFPILQMPHELCEVDAVGFGGLLMRRDVFDRVPKPWFTIDYKCGEDIAFCVKAREHGVRWFVDATYHMGHVGIPPIISKETHDQYMSENADKFNQPLKVSLGGKQL